MNGPYSFRDYIRECPSEQFIVNLALAAMGALATLGWLVLLPFAPVVLAFRRRIHGKRMANAWKRRNGYKCPDTFYWWMKYM